MKLAVIILSIVVLGSKGTRADDETTTAYEEMMSTSTSEEVNTVMKSVQYCSKSEIQTSMQQIDYAWTLSGALTYISHLGHSNYRKSHLQLNVSNLKFHPEQLSGNWSFALSKSADDSMKIKMTYETTEADHLAINGETLIKLPCGSLIHPVLHCEKVDRSHENGYSGQYQHQYQYGNSSGWGYPSMYMMASNKTTFETVWVVEDYVIQQLMEKRQQRENEENNGTRAAMTDEIDLLFHIDAVRTMPAMPQFSTDCKSETVESLKRKESKSSKHMDANANHMSMLRTPGNRYTYSSTASYANK